MKKVGGGEKKNEIEAIKRIASRWDMYIKENFLIAGDAKARQSKF